MLLIDVNVLVYAFRTEMPDHKPTRDWLSQLVNGQENFGVPELALTGFLRIVTRKPFMPPSTTAEAFDFCNALMASPRCLVIRPGPRQWSIFERLCRAINATGNEVPDVFFAAMALDIGCDWVTTDRDFARMPGLTWRHPMDSRSTTNPTRENAV